MKNQVIPSARLPGALRRAHPQGRGIVTTAIGMIPRRARPRTSSPKAGDMVSLARVFSGTPRWAWHAALELGVTPPMPRQYLRARPAGRARCWANADTRGSETTGGALCSVATYGLSVIDMLKHQTS